MRITQGSLKRLVRSFLHGPWIGLTFLLAAIWFLREEWGKVQPSEIFTAIHQVNPLMILLAFLMTAFCYLLLTMYDVLAFKYLRIKISFARTVFAAFVGYALSNNFSMTPSVAIRYRIYSTWGVGTWEFARLILFHILSTYLGFFIVAGLTLLFEKLPDLPGFHLPTVLGPALGGLFLSLVLVYLVWVGLQPKPIRIHKQMIELPTFSLTIIQSALASADWALTGSVLYLLFPDTPQLSYGHYLMTYLIAQVVGINSHLPGGLGAFEGTCIFLLSPFLTISTIVGALLLYRVTYYFLPLAISAILLLIFEIDQRNGTKHPRKWAK